MVYLIKGHSPFFYLFTFKSLFYLFTFLPFKASALFYLFTFLPLKDAFKCTITG